MFILKRRRQKGQSAIEAMLLSLALIFITKTALLIFWLGGSLLWIEHRLYQGLVCAAQQKEASLCQKNILKGIEKLNRLGEIKSIKIKKLSNKWKGEIQWRIMKKNFFIKQSFYLEL